MYSNKASLCESKQPSASNARDIKLDDRPSAGAEWLLTKIPCANAEPFSAGTELASFEVLQHVAGEACIHLIDDTGKVGIA